MTLWVLALCASLAGAAGAPARVSARAGSPVRTVPAVVARPVLGTAAMTPLGGAGLRGALLTGALGRALPASRFAPPAERAAAVDAAPRAAQGASRAAPAPRAAAPLAAARRAAGLSPEEPAAAASSPAPALSRSALETETLAGARGLTPALGARSAALPLVLATSASGEASSQAGRELFDEARTRPVLDARAPEPSASLAAASISAPEAATPAPALSRSSTEGDAPAPSAVLAPAGDDARARDGSRDTGFLPDAAPVIVRPPLPGSELDPSWRDAVGVPRPLAIDPGAAGLSGGHPPLLARPSRLTLSGSGLVVRVSPADARTRGAAPAAGPRAAAPGSTAASPIEGGRRLVSTEHIERGALLEAASASDAAIGRGLLGLAHGELPGALSGSMPDDAPREPLPPARRRGVPGGWALLLLPLAAAPLLRRFL